MFKYKHFFNFNYSDEQIKSIKDTLYFSAISINIVAPMLIVMIFFKQLESSYLIPWFSILICMFFLRIWVGTKLLKYLNTLDRIRTKIYLIYYLWIVIISGLLLGFIFFIATLHTTNTYFMFLMTIMIALTAGAIVTLGRLYAVTVVFILSLIVPIIVAFLVKGESLLDYSEALPLVSYGAILLIIIFKNKKFTFEYENNLALLAQYEEVINESSIVSKTDSKGIITYVNDNFCKISGYTSDELLGKPHSMIRHPDVPSSTFKSMWSSIKKDKKSWQGIIKNRAKNGDSYYVSATVSPILDCDKKIQGYIALRHDVTAIMSDKKQLFDYLEANKLSVLIMIQIEDYDVLEKFYDKKSVEKIENTFGDALLYLMPNSCNFQRVYGLGNGMYALASARRTCRKSQEELEEMLLIFLNNVKDYMVKLDGISYDISAICSYTYGVIQIYEDVKIGIEKAIENKESIVYADGLSGMEYAKALNNIEILHTLKVALDDKKIISYFQPIVNNLTKKVEKYESLVRLIDEFGEVISPNKFLEIAKKGRYYNQVTKIVLENSFKTLVKTNKEISINLSALDIESNDIQNSIFSLLEEHKEHCHRVIFELLESEGVKNLDTIIEFIHRVKPMGVKIAIDDFGAGYSSFERLLQYEPDILKIDGSLIKNILDNPLSKNIVESIVLFAKKQKIKTVAEFVSSEEIYYMVKDMGIDYSQGYAFGKPEDLFAE